MANEETTERLIQEQGATLAPRITPADIDAAILSVHYCNGAEFDGARFSTSEMSLPCMTLCILVLKNGFMVVGESACASPANFNEAVGRKVAYENARQKIWAFEGYRLRAQLALNTPQQMRTSVMLQGMAEPEMAPLGDPDE